MRTSRTTVASGPAAALCQVGRPPARWRTHPSSLQPPGPRARLAVRAPITTAHAALGSAECITVAVQRAGLLPGMLPVSSPWGVWMTLLAAGSFGLWAENNTRIGRQLSGALMATLCGMLLANVGVLPPHAPELQVVYKFLLPLAIPMLLYSANLKRMLLETGRLLMAFLLGSLMTLVGSAVAMSVLPLGPWLGDAGWRIGTALTARHIGGAVNYMAVSEMLSIPPSIFGAGLAADDLVLIFYFSSLYALAKNIGPDTVVEKPAQNVASTDDHYSASSTQPQQPSTAAASDLLQASGHGGPRTTTISVLEALLSLSLSAAICYVSHAAAARLGAPTQSFTILTGVTVLLATLFPQRLQPLVPSAEGVAQVLMQLFYATIGASADVMRVLQTAPILLVFCAVALTIHVTGVLIAGRALGFSRRELLIASNANIGGPSTVAGMAASKGWTSIIVPGILTSTLGYAIGNYLGLGLGYGLLINLAK